MEPLSRPARPVRRATAADIPEIVRVTNAAYRVEDFFIDGNRTSEAEVAEKMTHPGCAFLVIDVPAGAPGAETHGLAASVYVEGRAERLYFGMLSVAPAHQKTGLARALVDGVESHARRRGCTSVELDVVNLREELPPFYSKLGFTPTGTAPFLKGHKLKRPIHLILMSKQIA